MPYQFTCQGCGQPFTSSRRSATACSLKCRPVRIRQDRSGQVFGRLIILDFDRDKVLPSGQSQQRWWCRCECGVVKSVSITSLLSGHSNSCGCLHREGLSALMTTHGMSKTPEHRVWMGIKARCYSPKAAHYSYYGGRGITMDTRWRTSFADFYADMGPRPSSLYSIDRIDNDGPYAPGNCRWATMKEQCANRRPYPKHRRSRVNPSQGRLL